MGRRLVKVHDASPAYPVTDSSDQDMAPQQQCSSLSSFSVSDASAFTMENYIKAGVEQQQLLQKQQQQQQAAAAMTGRQPVPAHLLASPVSAVSSFSTATGGQVWGGEADAFVSPIARIRHGRNPAHFHPMSPLNVQPVQEEDECMGTPPTQHFPKIFAPKVNQVKFSPTIDSENSEDDHHSSDQEPGIREVSSGSESDNSITIEENTQKWEKSEAPRRRLPELPNVGKRLAEKYGGCCIMAREDMNEAWKCYKKALAPPNLRKCDGVLE